MKDSPATTEAPGGVKSAQRTVQLLEVLASASQPLSMAELAQRTGYPRSSLHALVRTLVDANWVESGAGGQFAIGPSALLTGTAYLDRDPSLPFAYRSLERLRGELDYTFHFARIIRTDVLYLATRFALADANRVSRIGRHLPAHATALGQALLAERTEAEVDATLEYPLSPLTDKTIVDRDELHAELERVRARGWALETEQNTMGVTCLAVTVDNRIPPTDSLSCSMPKERATKAEIELVANVLLAEARTLATDLRREGIR